jgi:hypothetical protein
MTGHGSKQDRPDVLKRGEGQLDLDPDQVLSAFGVTGSRRMRDGRCP